MQFVMNNLNGRALQGKCRRAHGRPRRRGGITLLELLIVVAITGVMLTLGGFAFRGIRRSSVLPRAKNAILAYTAVARNYAIANRVETMLVINPYNGRFELWHLNAPAQGGPWDPQSGGAAPPFTDGYAFAPVLDDAARLPLDGNDMPQAIVHPIDFLEPGRPQANNEPNLDNLTWVAFCFDENGKLVTRTRRIATRSYRYRDGTFRPNPNRLLNGEPNTKLIQPDTNGDGFADGWLVDVNDTPITSTQGFIVSDRSRMERFIGKNPAPAQIADPNNGWLAIIQPGHPGATNYSTFGESVVLDRYSGQQAAGGF